MERHGSYGVRRWAVALLLASAVRVFAADLAVAVDDLK